MSKQHKKSGSVSGGMGFITLIKGKKGLMEQSFSSSKLDVSNRISQALEEAFSKGVDFDPRIVIHSNKCLNSMPQLNSIETTIQDGLFSFKVDSFGVIKTTKQTKQQTIQKPPNQQTKTHQNNWFVSLIAFLFGFCLFCCFVVFFCCCCLFVCCCCLLFVV